MGVLNVTPDSFSDGGLWFSEADAVAHGRDLFAQGASIVDVGGESTRPGAHPVDLHEELRRVVPVVEALADAGRVSVDTRKAEVARAAVSAGATLINDVSAGLAPVAAELGVGWVAMHMQGTPETMQADPTYADVVDEVRANLDKAATAAAAVGVQEIWIDPGFGFGKTARDNLLLLRHLDRLVDLGWPVLVGLSRKATLGRLLAVSDAARAGDGRLRDTDLDAFSPVATDDRIEATIATQVWAMRHGAAMIRAHDVVAAVQAARVVAA
jgi:dihydropteroate synthase